MGALRPLRQGVRLRQGVDFGIWNRAVRGAWDARVSLLFPAGNASRIGRIKMYRKTYKQETDDYVLSQIGNRTTVLNTDKTEAGCVGAAPSNCAAWPSPGTEFQSTLLSRSDFPSAQRHPFNYFLFHPIYHEKGVILSGMKLVLVAHERLAHLSHHEQVNQSESR